MHIKGFAISGVSGPRFCLTGETPAWLICFWVSTIPSPPLLYFPVICLQFLWSFHLGLFFPSKSSGRIAVSAELKLLNICDGFVTNLKVGVENSLLAFPRLCIREEKFNRI